MRSALHFKLSLACATLLFPVSTFALTSITNCTQLQNMSANLAENYTLANNLDCGGATFTPVGSSSTPFTGTLNGNNYTIANVVINEAGNDVGLFGHTNGSTIQNVRLRSFTVTGNGNVGGLVGTALSTTVQNVGIINSTVNGSNRTGGIVGRQFEGSLSKGFGLGISISGADAVGGIVGSSDSADLDNLHVFSGSVNGIGSAAGGVLGNGISDTSATSLTNAYANATVSGNELVGGLVGYWNYGSYTCSLSNSFATGNVTGNNDVGGLVGVKFSVCTISNSAFNDHAGNPSVCVGTDGSAGATSCTTVSNNQSYFYSSTNAPLSSWDFNTIWQTGLTFPLLSGALLQPPATSFGATPSGTTVALSWTNPTNTDFSSVTVRRSTTAFPSTIADGTAVVSNSTSTSYNDTGLAGGTYYYSIFARDVWGYVSARATATAVVVIDTTTLPPTLTQPGKSSTQSPTILVQYTLPEAPLAGSVTLNFNNTAGTNVTVTMTNATTVNTTLDPTNFTASPSVSSATINSIPYGFYNVTLRYQDAAGNPAATTMNTNMQYPDPTANTSNGGGGGGGSQRTLTTALQRTTSSSSSAGAAAAHIHTLQERTCARVRQSVGTNATMLKRVNKRLQKMFGFSC